MDITYKFPGVKYSVDSIIEFQEESNWWRESFFHFYPQVNIGKFDSLSPHQRNEYLQNFLDELYNKDDAKSDIDSKLIKYNDHWNLHKNQIEDAFSEAFHCDAKNTFNNMVCNISFNPICPRYLNSRSFDIFYLNSEFGALGISLHEIIHFLWFDVWNRHFNDSDLEYETPHLKWVLSEMVVDPIMRKDIRLSGVSPYFEDGCAYACFYSMIINEKPILQTLYEMYNRLSLIDFMEQGYGYCEKYETEIRSQMD